MKSFEDYLNAITQNSRFQGLSNSFLLSQLFVLLNIQHDIFGRYIWFHAIGVFSVPWRFVIQIYSRNTNVFLKKWVLVPISLCLFYLKPAWVLCFSQNTWKVFDVVAGKVEKRATEPDPTATMLPLEQPVGQAGTSENHCREFQIPLMGRLVGQWFGNRSNSGTYCEYIFI